MSQKRAATAAGAVSRLAVAVIVALGAPQTVLYAQEPANPSLQDEVIVTGSRLRTSGMDMPNPVTVVTRAEVSVIAPTNLIEGVAELPQFYGSNTTQNPGNFFVTEGAGSLNLRGLQSKRTLQLLNGRRVVQSTIFGGPDINLFPETVISSVETVTGGASAAYGTDAVAGAVNFILDTDFEGFRANVSGGENDQGQGDHYEVSFGAGFAIGEKTHLLVSLERSEQDPIWGAQTLDYDWYKARALLENTAAGAGTTPDNPAFVPYDHITNLSASLDGIIFLPAAAGGAQILDANGNPSPFVPGSPCNTHGCSTVNGGSGGDVGLQGTQISPDTGRENVFGYIEHEFGDGFKVFGQFISGEAEFTSKGNAGLFPNPPGTAADRTFTVYSGNPFLPASIQQAMTANGLTQGVPFGRIGAFEDIAFDAYTQQTTETDSLTGGFSYDFDGSGFFGGGGWQLEGYYQAGETDVKAIQRGGIRLDRIYLAADVVTDPLTNQPACNVTVTTRGTATPLYPDCVPLNLFGRGRASPPAVDWVTGFEPGVQINAQGFLSATESMPHSYVSGENKQRVINIQQDVWEISANGKLAEGWAGPINMAFGYGFRQESFEQVVEVGPGGNINADPRFRPVMANNTALGIRGVPVGALASGNSVEIQFSNVPFARGEQDVKEAFTEVLVPLVSGRKGVQQLNMSAAVRWADYSGAGNQQSWKTGFDWAIVDQLRLRTTLSEDVRAATMGEKFDRTGGFSPPLNDFGITPTPSAYTATIFSNGTPDIKPEQARTGTFGIVYQPERIDSLSVSVDFYSVIIEDNIQQAGAQNVVTGCYQQSDAFLCSLITRGGPPSLEDPSINYISLVGVPYYNQARTEAKGIDYEVNYRKDVDWFGGGELIGVRLLASFLDERTDINAQGVRSSLEGTFGLVPTPNTGLPETSAVLSGNYNRGPMSLSLVARYASSMIIQRTWNTGVTGGAAPALWDIEDNETDAETVLDARFDYRFETAGGNVDLFFNVNDLLDSKPENFLTAPFSSNAQAGTGLGVTGENRGRRYSLGVRMAF
ncbi:MAG TPA: TonB-dependent receptor [Gammaproteobacteria bacterium]|nr:TonB-dependent receptor [Gammaproteobacteria bacterium]